MEFKCAAHDVWNKKYIFRLLDQNRGDDYQDRNHDVTQRNIAGAEDQSADHRRNGGKDGTDGRDHFAEPGDDAQKESPADPQHHINHKSDQTDPKHELQLSGKISAPDFGDAVDQFTDFWLIFFFKKPYHESGQFVPVPAHMDGGHDGCDSQDQPCQDLTDDICGE